MEDHKTTDELKKVIRRLDSLQKTVDLLYSDRSILEDILGRLSTVEHSLNLNKEHQTDVQKDLKADIRDIKEAVEDKVDEVRMEVQDKTIVVAKEDHLKKIKNILKVGDSYGK